MDDAQRSAAVSSLLPGFLAETLGPDRLIDELLACGSPHNSWSKRAIQIVRAVRRAQFEYDEEMKPKCTCGEDLEAMATMTLPGQHDSHCPKSTMTN